ncbi:unnamed protein product [Staurois parvus]|uniref:Uncharacterized protein n=1 Tax=Staurois parvus TaxID=386267 RepID=A0ABN9BVA6_9NEOB|nr:unnamed protein product [Staurois parvus]
MESKNQQDSAHSENQQRDQMWRIECRRVRSLVPPPSSSSQITPSHKISPF